MIKLGMLIGSRYEVLEKIGTGGMSDVYKAKDQKLNRLVAVKVLKQEFSENRNFVSKFRVEAQAAAGLMHPNIVNVYDVGEEGGIHYIVMELVEGITLKKYIEKKVRLTTKEAISIAIQVAMGIEAAHNNHIIHRDIKPQNIMISKEGKVKVTDFGIAKAASSNTITSNVMGSVHYTSPEQARGGFSDEKSDIYSTGITLFEMLTGRVPFNGDTTVAIAIKHIQSPMPTPRDFVPEIPISVENIVMKCTQKSPDKRYQSMGEMIKDLKHSLMNPDDIIAHVDYSDDTAKTRVIPQETPLQPIPIQSVSPIPDILNTTWEDRVPRRETYADEEDLAAIPNYTVSKRQNTNTKSYSYTDAEQDYPEEKKKTAKQGTKSKTPVKSKGSKNNAPKNVSTKNVSGQKTGGKKSADRKSADKKITDKKTAGNRNSAGSKNQDKTKAKKSKDYDEYEDMGYIQSGVNKHNMTDLDYESSPSSRKNAKDEYDYNPKAEGFRTLLTIIAAVIIGCIVLYCVGQATGLLEQIGMTNQLPGQSTDSTQTVPIPEFVGLEVGEVQKTFHAAGLGCKKVSAPSAQYKKNLVIAVALEDGTEVFANDKIAPNTTIVLTVSAGTDGINIPSVVGLSEAEGTATLTKEGFQVTKTQAPSKDYAKGLIASQTPEGDSFAAVGSMVTLVISTGGEGSQVLMPRVLGYSKEAAVSTLEAAGLEIGEVSESYSNEYPEGQICYQSFEEGSNVAQGTKVDVKISIGSEVATYNCTTTIQAPANYIGGNAEVILTTADGVQIWYATVTSFPAPINVTGFSSSSAYGIITIAYVVNKEETVTDAEGNQTTQIVQDVAQVHQNVQFTKN